METADRDRLPRQPIRLYSRWLTIANTQRRLSLWAYYNCDSSSIRLQHATRFFVRSHTRSYTRISGRRVLHVDWQLNAQLLLYTYMGLRLPYIVRVCVNMPEIVYTKAIKCQYAEYTINHCEIIMMLKWKTCGHILRAFIAYPLHVKLSESWVTFRNSSVLCNRYEVRKIDC